VADLRALVKIEQIEYFLETDDKSSVASFLEVMELRRCQPSNK
jgi:hypothetical protein